MTALGMFIIAGALAFGFWLGSAVTIAVADWLSDRRRLL